MHRPYTTDMYYQRIHEIRKEIRDISISCDIMTGFPYESDTLFEESYAFLKKCEFSFLHVFPFSEREGTEAVKMDEKVDIPIRKERAAKCIALSKELQIQYQSKFIGKIVDVITEKGKQEGTPGHSSEYIPVYIENRKIPRGTMVKVRITKQEDTTLIGEVIEA